MPRIFILSCATAALSGISSAQTWGREDVDFESIEQRAGELAAQPFEAPDKEALPDWLKELTYDHYRDIRFDPEKALWAEDELPFRAMFFHPGYLFREPVVLHEFTGTHDQRVRLTEEFFNYGPLVGERGELPPDAGFAGFRLHAPLNGPHFDELAVFKAGATGGRSENPSATGFPPAASRWTPAWARRRRSSRRSASSGCASRRRTTRRRSSTRCSTVRLTPAPTPSASPRAKKR